MAVLRSWQRYNGETALSYVDPTRSDEELPVAVTTPTAPTEAPTSPAMAPPSQSRWIEDWRPDDPEFWDGGGSVIAKRNLVFSIFSEHIGFSIWSMWSVFVLFLGPEFGLDPGKKFLLTMVPTLVGSLMRLPYTFAVAKFGGRNWTIISSALLVIPCMTAAYALRPGVSFTTLLVCAAFAGFGGGNFSSSMSNIEAFYPQRLKGWALGLNAGGGNLGVAAVQLVGLGVLAVYGAAHPRIILAVYLPLIALSVAGAALAMDNLRHVTNEKRAMREVVKEPHAWAMSFLYIGTFGSFIGFGFAFGQVLQTQFYSDLEAPKAALKAAHLTFLGPLLGSLVRPIGGRLADKLGGARVAITTFVGMAVGASVVLVASRQASLPLFLVGFVTLFVLSGLGNGATYKMIPAIFRAKADRAVLAGADPSASLAIAQKRSRALIGVAGAIGGLGGVLVNLAFRQSFLTDGTGDGAYMAFIAFYVACVFVTWAVYLRPSSHRLAGV